MKKFYHCNSFREAKKIAQRLSMQHKRSWYVSRIEGQWLVRLPPLKWQCGGGQFTFHCLSCSNKDQPINQEQVSLKARDKGEIFKCYKCGSSTYRIYDKKNKLYDEYYPELEEMWRREDYPGEYDDY